MDAEGFHLLDLLQALGASLDEFEAALGDFLHQSDGFVPVGFPGVEVPAHRADDVGSGVHGVGQLIFGGDLHHDVQPLAGGKLQEGLETVLAEEGGHEEDGVGAEDLALLDLVFLEDELAADQGQFHLGAHFGEVLVLTEVKELVRGHRKGASPVFGQAFAVSGGLVGLPDLSTARVAPGHFT